MEAPFTGELQHLHAAAGALQPGDLVVHWDSAFGLIVIEVRAGQVYVNSALVEPATPAGRDAAA